MNPTLLPIRLVFVAICAFAGWLLCYTVPEWDSFRWLGVAVGGLLAVLTVLTDLLLKGFSLRGLSAITFGLGIGTLIAHWIGVSPIFRWADPQALYLAQIALFLVSTYLCTVIALRGKDEFNLVIPYVRFVPRDVNTGQVVVDTSALTDGRIARVCEAGFFQPVVIIPQFVLDELHGIADSSESDRQARGRRGLETLAALRRVRDLEIRILPSEVDSRKDLEAKLVFIARTERASILTLDTNLAKLAEFQGVRWLNVHALAKALHQEPALGEVIDLDLVKPGKEEHQAVGFLSDGSMVVVEGAHSRIGFRVRVEVTRVVPAGGGRLYFGRLA